MKRYRSALEEFIDPVQAAPSKLPCWCQYFFFVGVNIMIRTEALLFLLCTVN